MKLSVWSIDLPAGIGASAPLAVEKYLAASKPGPPAL